MGLHDTHGSGVVGNLANELFAGFILCRAIHAEEIWAEHCRALDVKDLLEDLSHVLVLSFVAIDHKKNSLITLVSHRA